MAKNAVSRAVTARFPVQDYLLLQQEAEQRGCTIADVIRNAWSQFQQQQQIQQQLLRLEQRQRKMMFETLCVVIGLQASEREQALQKLQSMGVKW
jgi:Lon protease-like protein